MKKACNYKGFAFAAIAALLLSSMPALAQSAPKIGIIDLKKIFEGYYKTKQADAQLKERATDSEKVLKGMVEDYQKGTEDYRKLIDSANDQAVSSEERDRRKKSAENKLLEMQEMEKSITQFRRQTATNLDDQKRRLRDNILREIREVINNRSRAAGYTMVVDVSAESLNQTPIIVYNNGQNDISDEVLTEINRTAPAGAANAIDAPVKATETPSTKTEKK